MTMAWGPDVCSQPSTVQLDWHSPENSRFGRSTTGAPFSSQMRASSHWAHVTGVKESGDAVVNVMRWVSDGLGMQIPGGSETTVPWLLLRTGMKSWERSSDLMLVQWALGSSWCRTMPGLMWPECVGSSWMMKALMPLIGRHIPLT